MTMACRRLLLIIIRPTIVRNIYIKPVHVHFGNIWRTFVRLGRIMINGISFDAHLLTEWKFGDQRVIAGKYHLEQSSATRC